MTASSTPPSFGRTRQVSRGFGVSQRIVGGSATITDHVSISPTREKVLPTLLITRFISKPMGPNRPRNPPRPEKQPVSVKRTVLSATATDPLQAVHGFGLLLGDVLVEVPGLELLLVLAFTCQVSESPVQSREYQVIPRKELVLLGHDLGHLGQRHVLPPVQIGDGILVLGKVGVGSSGRCWFCASRAWRNSKGKSHDGWGSRGHLRPRPTPEVNDQTPGGGWMS